VPDVLLKGVHADIEAWRRREALEITRARRPEMLETAPLTDADHETLKKMEKADAIIASLAEKGIQARRMDMFEEAGYARAWINRFVLEEKRKSARKACISAKKHVGYLYQAFELGYAPRSEEAASFAPMGEAVLYYNEENLAFFIDKSHKLGKLPPKCVLTAPDMAWTMAMGKNELYFASVSSIF